MADDMNMNASHLISDLARTDRDDKRITRFGQLPFIVRNLGGYFMIEDQRKWEPAMGAEFSMEAAIERIAALVAAERKAG